MVLLVCDATLSACASYNRITACLSAVGCLGECGMPEVLYWIRAMHAEQVCNRWAHGMGNDKLCRIVPPLPTSLLAATEYPA